MTGTLWRITGEGVVSCNCAWGCPCQFNGVPTNGRCEGIGTWEITKGHYGETRLDGLRFAMIASWPGPLHEGNGTLQMVIDEHANPEQRQALDLLFTGKAGGSFFEIFSSICPNKRETIVAPIHFEADREARRATVRIPGLLENDVAPLLNPVMGDEHRASIHLPFGFEYQQAEVANATRWKTTGGQPLDAEHSNKHAHLNPFDWSNL